MRKIAVSEDWEQGYLGSESSIIEAIQVGTWRELCENMPHFLCFQHLTTHYMYMYIIMHKDYQFNCSVTGHEIIH